VSDRALRLAVAGLAMAGAAVAAYLTYTRYAETAIACTTGGCEAVQSSDYAELLGVPVAVLGLLAYVLLLGTAFFTLELARLAGAVVAVSGALFAAYLLFAQLFLIDAICQWCVASDILIGLLAVACVLRLRSGEADDPALRVEVHPLRR
jgi:uncharacterized membrane protein